MKTKLAAVLAASTLSVGVAQASSISISAFDISSFNDATDFAVMTIEDFENTGLPAGALGGALSTSVGTFSSIGGTGTGQTCAESGGAPNCVSLALFNTTTSNDQGNLVPDDGDWSLNSNGTYGVNWEVATGGTFNRIVFGLMDAADFGATVTVSTDDGSSVSFSDFANANQQLVVIDFGSRIASATVRIENSVLNDSFSIDGASVGAVPVPAAGFLLLGGLGALAAVRRRKASV